MVARSVVNTALLGVLLVVPLAQRSVLAHGDDDRGDHRRTRSGAVYTLTNSAEGNGLVVIPRGRDGTLGDAVTIPTGGLGTGAGLGSQGALAMGDGDRFLYAVNAGSDEISVFRAGSGTPELVQVVASGGHNPISVTIHDDLLYVLNAGGSSDNPDSITGFRVRRNGMLDPIAGSTQSLSADATGPAQVGFSRDGKVLVVTEKGTNLIDTFVVDHHGRAGAGVAHPSAGMTPFGFAVDARGVMVVTEAFGGMPGQSTVSTYRISRDGQLTLIDGVVPTHQTAACWAATSGNGRYTYTTNTGSNSVTGFSISGGGHLAPLSDDGRTGETSMRPIDADFVGSKFLYVLTGGSHEVQGFSVGNDGTLQPLNALGGLAAGDVGLIAR